MENLTPPPPSPQENKTSNIVISQKNFAVFFFLFAIVILVFVLAIDGDKVDTTPTTLASAPVITNPPVSQANKYDEYMNHVLNNSGQANTWSKAKVIEFGDVVCQALDNNASVREVVAILSKYATSDSDLEFFASVTFASITYICPEYTPDLRAYLASGA